MQQFASVRLCDVSSAKGSKHIMKKPEFFSSLLFVCGLILSPAFSQAQDWQHAISLLEKPRYAADFKHFDYVNPKAPIGGIVRMGAQGSFDNFNPVVSGIKGQLAAGLSLVYETLTVPSQDEVMTSYGLLAEGMRVASDFSSVTYRLRKEARWHDGKPVTPEDVIFSFNAFKANSPQYAFYYAHVRAAEKTAERDVTFYFDEPGNRELPQIVGQFMILPKHIWTGNGPDGKPRDITQTTMLPPVGSGPYKLKQADPPHTTSYALPVDDGFLPLANVSSAPAPLNPCWVSVKNAAADHRPAANPQTIAVPLCGFWVDWVLVTRLWAIPNPWHHESS